MSGQYGQQSQYQGGSGQQPHGQPNSGAGQPGYRPPQPPKRGTPVWVFVVIGVLVVALFGGATALGVGAIRSYLAFSPSAPDVVEVPEDPGGDDVGEVAETVPVESEAPKVEEQPVPTPVKTVTVEVVREVEVEREDGDPPFGAVDPHGLVLADHYAKECVRVTRMPFSAAARNNESTSCPFVKNVRKAYVESGLYGAPGTVQAYSPTTGLWYDMRCEAWDDWNNSVECTGGKRARVLIYDGVLAPSG